MEETDEDDKEFLSCHSREDFVAVVRKFLSMYEKATADPNEWRSRVLGNVLLSNAQILNYALEYLDYLQEGEIGGGFDIEE